MEALNKVALAIAASGAIVATAISSAQAVTKPMPPTFSIAGIHIGERPADVLSDLKRAGYRVVKVSQSDTFKQRLSDARNAELRQPNDRGRTTDVGSVFATQADQHIRVNFDDNSTGSRVVSAIFYEASSVAHPFGRGRATMISRYGQPQAEDGTGPVWTSMMCPTFARLMGCGATD